MLCVSCLFFLIYSVACLEVNVIDFSLDFFKGRDVPSICLLICDDRTWNHKFARNASKISIAVSHVNINFLSDLDSIGLCLNRVSTNAGVLIDTKCPLYEDAIIYASENLFLDANHKWLIIDVDPWISNISSPYNVEGNENMPWLMETFQKINLSIDADVTLSLQKDLIKKLNTYKYYRRWDFENSTLNYVAVMSTPPKVFDVDMLIGDFPAPGVAIMTLTGTRLLVEIAQLHNIRYNYTILDRWIGKFERNSTLVAATSIYYKEQDVTPVLRVTSEIFQKVDMISPPVTSIEYDFWIRMLVLLMIIFSIYMPGSCHVYFSRWTGDAFNYRII